MSHCTRSAAMIVAALAATPAAAQPGGSMNVNGPGGTVIYGQPAGPTSETSPGPSSSSFATSAFGDNQIALNWWFYRVQGDSRERPLGIYNKSDGFTITGTSSWPSGGFGNTATYRWTENGAAGPRFTATYTLALSGGNTSYDATLSQAFQITNPNSSPLSLALFNLTYWTLGNGSLNQTATGNINAIAVTNGLYQDTHSAIGASSFQVAQDQGLINLLTNSSVNDLNNTGLPFSGIDCNTAFEWALTIPPNSSATVQSSLITARAVPEPSALLLCGAAAAGLVTRWQLRRRRARAHKT